MDNDTTSEKTNNSVLSIIAQRVKTTPQNDDMNVNGKKLIEIESILVAMQEKQNALLSEQELLSQQISNLKNEFEEFQKQTLDYQKHDLFFQTKWQTIINETRKLHKETFGEFRQAYTDKKAVIVGCGPSLNNFVPFEEEMVYIGVNRAVTFDKVEYSFLFSGDFEGIQSWAEEFYTYRGDKCIKFLGDLKTTNKKKMFPLEVFRTYSSVRGYNMYFNAKKKERWLFENIDEVLLGNYETTAIQAMQFALFAGFKEIYLVGMDCTNSFSHFGGDDIQQTPGNSSTRDKNLIW